DMATDVLSFAMTEGEDGNFATEGNLLLGDIVISMQRAAEQGEKYGHSTEREAVFLFIHGLLHLLGYDHERGVEEEQEMFAVQERIIQFIYE
ncbi:MAG: rRNA maturation RNase YbeY, partial [Clostridiales bacterium]